MTGKLSLILGFHAHIFPSAANEEFEELYRTCLSPFISVLNRYPKIPAVLHYSGSLFDRLEQKKPELFLLIKDMAARKQIELLGGGYYEPILSLIPPVDRIGQVEMLTTYIRQNFGRKPQGCMLSHSGWEQSLAGVLPACGMAYTFLSEEQFTAAHCRGEDLFGPVYTEEQGKLLVVFPVFSSLARMGTEGVYNVLLGEDNFSSGLLLGEEERKLITVFPVFPKENAEEKIRSFFDELIQTDRSRDLSLELTTPGRVYRNSTSLPKVYFFSSGDSSCPQPRSFLTQYPETNGLYARIYYVQNLINQLRGDKSRKRSAREELWKAQGAETLIHTNNRDVRRYAHKAILAAERIIREKNFKPSLLTFDFDLDRIEEYLFQDKNINCYVRTRGAAVFELDYLPRGWNYLDSFTGANTGSGRIDRRCAFMDMLLPGEFVPPADSSSGVYSFPGPEPFPSDGRFCGNEEYRLLSAERAKLRASFVLPVRKGVPFGSIEIQKTYSLEKNTLYLSYRLSNKGEEKTIFCFVPRFDLALAGERILFRKSQGEEETSADRKGEKRRVMSLEEQGARGGASLSVSFQSPCDLYYAGLEELGANRNLCFLPIFQVFLNPGYNWENRITLGVCRA
ncbi:MAG: DUF1925 domain-containing protein [Treponema sp.]|jgi:hypothetical protein|nr:DUF1925 domain-containing protein [Treponema sp.]